MPQCVADIQYAYNSLFVGTNFYLALLNDTRYAYDFTVSGNVLTTSSNHNYLLNTKVQLQVSGGGTLPSPLNPATTYYVRDVGANTLTLSATYGGSLITLTDLGTGTFTITDLATDYTLPDVSNYIRQETNYEGISARPLVTFSSGDIITTNTSVSLEKSVIVDNTSGTSPILFNSVLLIRGGSSTIGDTTGTPARFKNLGATTVVAAGAADSFKIPISTALGV